MAVKRRKRKSTLSHTGHRGFATEAEARRSASAPSVDFRSLFERAPDAILVVDEEGRYIDANPAACDLIGYTREELLRKRVGDLVAATERARSAKRFDLLRRTGLTRTDRILQRKDGTHVPVEAHAMDLGDGTYATILRDISQRVADQAQLQRSLDAYSTLVDLCHAAVISAEPKGRITSWNPAAEFLFGYAAAEAIGMPITKLIPSRLRRKHLAGFRQHLSETAEERFGRTFRTTGVRKDGTEVPIEVSAAVGRQGAERVFNTVIRDVSEHQEVVEKLNDALQRLRFHVERMPLAYIVWDADFRVVEWNPTAERMFGYSKDEAVGQQAYDLIVPPEAVAAVEKVWSDLLGGDTSSYSLNANKRKDGSRLMVEWFNSALQDSAGRIRSVASMAMDVSERQAIEARIRDAQKTESLGVMASGVAHDFNSSLMVILGNTALLRSAMRLPSAALEHIELIEKAGLRAGELIRHLLTYARTGRHNPEPMNLNEVIREGLRFVRSSVDKAHTLDFQPADRLPTVLADRSQIEQILLNLCLNAGQAITGSGTIEIVTREAELSRTQAARCVPHDAKPGRYVEMVVADTGCGMDEVTVLRVFDPFFTTKAEGHGLGLAAVLGILRRHDAVAMVDSKVGAGTKVHVFFPARDDLPAPGRRSGAGRRRSKSGRTG